MELVRRAGRSIWGGSGDQGLGDTIARGTKRVGIEPCDGCRNRQARLNELVPYKRSATDPELGS